MVYLYFDILLSRMNKVSSSMNKVSICYFVEIFKMLDDVSICKE